MPAFKPRFLRLGTSVLLSHIQMHSVVDVGDARHNCVLASIREPGQYNTILPEQGSSVLFSVCLNSERARGRGGNLKEDGHIDSNRFGSSAHQPHHVLCDAAAADVDVDLEVVRPPVVHAAVLTSCTRHNEGVVHRGEITHRKLCGHFCSTPRLGSNI